MSRVGWILVLHFIVWIVGEGARTAKQPHVDCTGSACNATWADQGPMLMQLPRVKRWRALTLAQDKSVRAVSAAEACQADGTHCLVPAGSTFLVDSSFEVDTITVEGNLVWDTSKDGLELRTGYLLVQGEGRLEIGSEDAPMENQATIYIKKGQTHERLGTRFMAGVGSGVIQIHGRRLNRTWTLLSRTAYGGATQLYVKHDPQDMGWRVGDRIGLATTSRGRSTTHVIESIGPANEEPAGCGELPDTRKTCSPDRCRVLADFMGGRTCDTYCSESNLECEAAFEEEDNDCNVKAEVGCGEVYENGGNMICQCKPPETPISSGQEAFSGSVIHFKEPLTDEHWGGYRSVEGHWLEMAAEVVNMERNILITGDHDDFHTTNQGLHTLMYGKGHIDVRYTRLEYCGQRDFMGRYCLHFHIMSTCPECVFEGNSVVDSAQVGITIHGTHKSLVSNNIIWDARGVGIYTEDGNEMDNVIKQNVVICSWWEYCSVNWQANIGLVAGIFLIGMTNDVIENHVAGHENCIWTPGGAHGDGQGRALGKVCPIYTPFGEIRGNVNHDCQRFGLYLDNQFPRNIQRDEDGYVIDKTSCQEFTVDGQDNGVTPANVILDEFDWHNMFVGQYNMGDVQFVNYVAVNNAHNMYWKSSKNFADGRLWHIVDSKILNDATDPIGKLEFLGPSGPHVFGIKNTVFSGGPVGFAAISAGQHCGLGSAGGPCNVQYLLENVSTSGVQGQKVQFGAHCTDAGYVLPVFLANDDSLGGYRSLVSEYLNGFAEVDGCEETADSDWANGIGCSQPIRRLNIWGEDLGDLTFSGPGYQVPSDDSAPTDGLNAGRMVYEPVNGNAYGAPVLVGGTYSIEGSWIDGTVFDFSDNILGAYFDTPNESTDIQVLGAQCTMRASDDRRFLSPKGPVPRVLSTHTRIEDGVLSCGGIGNGSIIEFPPDDSFCKELDNVVVHCSSDGCKVLVSGMANRSCVDYCTSNNVHCVGSWRPADSETGCSASSALSVGCSFMSSEEEWLCMCSLESQAEENSTTPSTTIIPQDPMAPTPSNITGTRTPTNPSCVALPHVKQACSSDGCKVLAGGMTGLTCLEYCARSGLECVGAWEDEDDTCSEKEEWNCRWVYPETSDLICQCSDDSDSAAEVGETPTPSPSPSPAPAPSPSPTPAPSPSSITSTTSPSMPAAPTPTPAPTSPAPTPAATTTRTTSSTSTTTAYRSSCKMSTQYEDRCSYDGCTVRAGGMQNSSCSQYCTANGMWCQGAWQPNGDKCMVQGKKQCDEGSGDGSSLICACTMEAPVVETTTTTFTRAPLQLEGDAQCQLANVKEFCSSSGCEVLVRDMAGRSCETYCEENGLACAAAWEDDSGGCTHKQALSCSDPNPDSSGDDLICYCIPKETSTTIEGPSSAGPVPAPTPSTTLAESAGNSDNEQSNSQEEDEKEGSTLEPTTTASPTPTPMQEPETTKAPDAPAPEPTQAPAPPPNPSTTLSAAPGPTQAPDTADEPTPAPDSSTTFSPMPEEPHATGDAPSLAPDHTTTLYPPSKSTQAPVATAPAPAHVPADHDSGESEEEEEEEASEEDEPEQQDQDEGEEGTSRSTTQAPPFLWNETMNLTNLNCTVFGRVKEECSQNGCKVLVDEMLNRSCSSFCAHSGLACMGAERPLSADRDQSNCTAAEESDTHCEDIQHNSSQLLCECTYPEVLAAMYYNATEWAWPEPILQENQIEEDRETAGSWGGSCTCPDGQVYEVGDRWDGCVDGAQSLACYGGHPSQCEKVKNVNRSGILVYCGSLHFPLSPPNQTDDRSNRTNETQPILENIYEQVETVGAWGGFCECPDGQVYQVGDQRDGCARGSLSLACYGGRPTSCEMAANESRYQWQVTCAPLPPRPRP